MFTGKVVSVDAVSNTLIVKPKNVEDTFYVDSKAVIKSGKIRTALSDLNTVASVTVPYKNIDGRKIATKITEKKAKTAKAY